MENWPVIHSEAQDARNQLCSTHRPIPLPAYDMDGNLIPPDCCKTALPGAIARVTFTLHHWFIGSKPKEDITASNSFVADIQLIRVLVDPPFQITSPKKRKTTQRDPDDNFITKKITTT